MDPWSLRILAGLGVMYVVSTALGAALPAGSKGAVFFTRLGAALREWRSVKDSSSNAPAVPLQVFDQMLRDHYSSPHVEPYPSRLGPDGRFVLPEEPPVTPSDPIVPPRKP